MFNKGTSSALAVSLLPQPQQPGGLLLQVRGKSNFVLRLLKLWAIPEDLTTCQTLAHSKTSAFSHVMLVSVFTGRNTTFFFKKQQTNWGHPVVSPINSWQPGCCGHGWASKCIKIKNQKLAV